MAVGEKAAKGCAAIPQGSSQLLRGQAASRACSLGLGGRELEHLREVVPETELESRGR